MPVDKQERATERKTATAALSIVREDSTEQFRNGKYGPVTQKHMAATALAAL